MTISYNLNIPDGPNNPSNDQPKMKVNTNAVDSWTAVDHVKFDTSPAGTHKQVTFSSKNAAGAQTDPQSVLYTGNGVEFANIAQLFFRNQSAIFPVSIIRAFGSFVWSNNNTTLINGYNCTVQVQAVANPTSAVVTLTTGATTGTNFVVIPFVTASGFTLNALPLTYAIAANQITFSSAVTTLTNQTVSFAVLQI